MASELALVDPANGMTIAFDAAPGTVGSKEPGRYGAYATSLTEMIAFGGGSTSTICSHASACASTNSRTVAKSPGLRPSLGSRSLSPNAPPMPNKAPVADLRGTPIRSYSSVEDAYAAAARDRHDGGYELIFVNQPILIFWNSGYAPPPPLFFLPARPREFAVLPPPPSPRERFLLPAPGATAFPLSFDRRARWPCVRHRRDLLRARYSRRRLRRRPYLGHRHRRHPRLPRLP